MCPPLPPRVIQHVLLSANISHQFTQHIKVASLVKRGRGAGAGGGGQGQKSKNRWKNLYQVMKKKILDYFQSISRINVSIHGCNCCKTGIKVSKCVYLASMVVKIKHTVAGHNHDILQQCIFVVHASQSTGPKRSKNCQNIWFCPSKLFCVHGKVNTNKFCSIYCYISPLGSLPAISINILWAFYTFNFTTGKDVMNGKKCNLAPVFLGKTLTSVTYKLIGWNGMT